MKGCIKYGALALLLMLCTALFSCNGETRFTVRLSSPPADTVYSLGDTFRTEGLSLIVTYSDGSIEEVDVTANMVTFSSEYAGAAVAVIAYTYNGYTAYTYVNTVIRDTLHDARTAALAAIDAAPAYTENKTDSAVLALYHTATQDIATAKTVDAINTARDTFLSAVATVTSDKTVARTRVAAVSLDGLTGEYLALAQNERARAILSISLARTSEEAEEFAALYETQVQNLRNAMATDLSPAEKRDRYVALEEYFRRTVEDNRVLYDEEEYSALVAAYNAASLGVLSADTKSEADAFRDALHAAILNTETLADKVYGKLLTVYKEGAVLFTAECESAITALRAALDLAESTLPADRLTGLASYAVSVENRIDALTYTDGRIDLSAAVAAVEARYATLIAAKSEADAIAATVGEIGTVTLESEAKITAAEGAYETWRTTYAVDEKNSALLLGTSYGMLLEKKNTFTALRTEAVADAENVKNSADAVAMGDYLTGMAPEDAIVAAEAAYTSWIETYGAATASTYLGDSETKIAAARNAYEAKLCEYDASKSTAHTALTAAFNEVQALKPEKVVALSEILSEGHAAIDAITFDTWKADTAAFTAIVEGAKNEMDAL